MKLLRHILSHLFLISIFIVVISVFYYRTFLFPVDVVDKVEGYVVKIYPDALKFKSHRQYFWARAEKVHPEQQLEIASDKPAISEPVEIKNKQAAVVQENTITVPDDKKEKEAEVVAMVEAELSQVVADIVQEPVQVVTAPIVETEKTMPAVQHAEVKDSDTSSERELLISARSAFNKGDMKNCEKYYQQLSELDNDNPDIFGELGNVYYSQGKWSEAAQAYYEAATRLIENGNRNQVMYLHRVMQGLDADYAEKLAQLIRKNS